MSLRRSNDITWRVGNWVLEPQQAKASIPMPEIRAFRGWRFNPAAVGELSNVIAPPYDVLDQPTVRELLKKSPYNVVRLELPTAVTAVEGRPGELAYAQAASLLKKWVQEGILIEEPDPALYLYRQQFSLGGQRLVRTGVFAVLRLAPFSNGIYPHEETLAGPKADRLALLRHVRTNVSPIFGVYDDRGTGSLIPLKEAVRGQPPLTALDLEGTVHEVWPVYDEEAVNQVASELARRNVFIADGHHRYETALAYRDELREQLGDRWTDDHPANFVLTALVPAGDPGLRILPTHRLMDVDPTPTMTQVRDALSPLFSVDIVGSGPTGAQECWRRIETSLSEPALAVGTASDNLWAVVEPEDPDCVARLRPDRSPVWCQLAVNLAHEVLIPQLLRAARMRRLHYERDVVTVARRLESGAYNVAVLVPPPSIEQFLDVSARGERMPAKSTYFYPKVATGLVLYRHER